MPTPFCFGAVFLRILLHAQFMHIACSSEIFQDQNDRGIYLKRGLSGFADKLKKMCFREFASLDTRPLPSGRNKTSFDAATIKEPYQIFKKDIAIMLRNFSRQNANLVMDFISILVFPLTCASANASNVLYEGFDYGGTAGSLVGKGAAGDGWADACTSGCCSYGGTPGYNTNYETAGLTFSNLFVSGRHKKLHK